MSAKHTPGPWAYVDSEILDATGDWVIADIRRFGDAPCAVYDFDQSEANARLIAAAPDLLATLKEAREFMRSEYPDSSLKAGNWPGIKPIVERWDSVIAKAESQS